MFCSGNTRNLFPVNPRVFPRIAYLNLLLPGPMPSKMAKKKVEKNRENSKIENIQLEYTVRFIDDAKGWLMICLTLPYKEVKFLSLAHDCCETFANVYDTERSPGPYACSRDGPELRSVAFSMEIFTNFGKSSYL